MGTDYVLLALGQGREGEECAHAAECSKDPRCPDLSAQYSTVVLTL